MGVARSDRIPAPVALGVAVIAISCAAILVREADAGALVISFWRTAGGALLLAPFAWQHRERFSQLDRSDLGLLLVSGLCLALHFALWLGSLELTTVASSVTIVTMSPLFVALFGTTFLGEASSRRVWIGIGLCVAGAITIGIGDAGEPGETSNALLGDVMALGGALAMAGYMLVGRRFRRDGVPNVVFAVPTYAIAALVLLPIVLAGSDPVMDLDTRTWILLAAMVLGPQLLGHALLTWVLDRLTATLVSVTTLLEPIGATVLAWTILDEVPAALFWLGAPIVLAGLAVTLTDRRAHAAPAL